MSNLQSLSPRGQRKARAVPTALMFLVVRALPLIFDLGLKVGWAQLPAPNALVVPPLPPSPPAQLSGPGEHRRRAGPAVDPVPAGAIRVSRATGFQLLLFRRWHANSLDGAGDCFRLLERQH